MQNTENNQSYSCTNQQGVNGLNDYTERDRIEDNWNRLKKAHVRKVEDEKCKPLLKLIFNIAVIIAIAAICIAIIN